MGAVMYAGAGLAESPYAHLLSPTHWAEIGKYDNDYSFLEIITIVL